jgi:hypothetical protein
VVGLKLVEMVLLMYRGRSPDKESFGIDIISLMKELLKILSAEVRQRFTL